MKMPLPELAHWAADHGFGALDIGGPTPEAVEAVRGAGLEVGTFDCGGRERCSRRTPPSGRRRRARSPRRPSAPRTWA